MPICLDITTTSGIYKIINRLNGKYYVGSSNNIYNRWNQHKFLLMRNSHFNSHLQNAWNKYGANNFLFLPFEKTSVDNLMAAEQKYLDIAYNEQDKCYNQSFASSFPLHTPQTKEKIRNSLIAYYKIHQNATYGKSPSAHSVERMRKSKTGVKHSDIHRTNISRKLKGLVRSDYTKLKMSLSKQGMNNYNYDHIAYAWKNKHLPNTFTGTQYEFSKKYNLLPQSVNLIVKKRRASLYGWTIDWSKTVQ